MVAIIHQCTFVMVNLNLKYALRAEKVVVDFNFQELTSFERDPKDAMVEQTCHIDHYQSCLSHLVQTLDCVALDPTH